MKKWKIWAGGDLDIFRYKEGDVVLEKTYMVSSFVDASTPAGNPSGQQ
ncbi:MAG: hypothetical protein UW64_C0031G0006 [Microgenomates group bacterium GW2011_GWC1_44_37]|nr:MAG: hypothetical protein UW64_C0031G0006 [Microgenomates group bacterium GW2011_GWC1_44_37]